MNARTTRSGSASPLRQTTSRASVFGRSATHSPTCRMPSGPGGATGFGELGEDDHTDATECGTEQEHPPRDARRSDLARMDRTPLPGRTGHGGLEPFRRRPVGRMRPGRPGRRRRGRADVAQRGVVQRTPARVAQHTVGLVQVGHRTAVTGIVRGRSLRPTDGPGGRARLIPIRLADLRARRVLGHSQHVVQIRVGHCPEVTATDPRESRRPPPIVLSIRLRRRRDRGVPCPCDIDARSPSPASPATAWPSPACCRRAA